MKNKLGKIKIKGFVFSIEATISLLLFSIIILAVPIRENVSLKELLITQQENDLLKVWGNSSELLIEKNTLIDDAKKMFGENFTIFVNQEKVYDSKKQNSKNCISSEGKIIEKITLLEKNIKIIVCE